VPPQLNVVCPRFSEVIKPIPQVQSGVAAPWFGKPGLGTQYQLPMSIDELVRAGFIKVTT
jgi:hypothetical protein